MIKRLLLSILACIFFTIQYAHGQQSVARKWNEALLFSIRKDFARPTVHARNLFHVSAAMYDAWAAYDTIAKPYLLGQTVHGYTVPFDGISPQGDLKSQREEAISYAAFRLLKYRFQNAPPNNISSIQSNLNSVMTNLGYDINFTSIDYSTGSAAALGNYIAQYYISFGLQDGSNEAGGFGNQFYSPVNPPLNVPQPGNPNIVNYNRWQPLALDSFVDQNGNVLLIAPTFLSPEWGKVVPFSLSNDDLTIHNRNGLDWMTYHDPGNPPFLNTSMSDSLSDEYKWNFSLVSTWSSHLTNEDTVLWDISPASIGNVQSYPLTLAEYHDFYNLEEGGDASTGYEVNPKTGQPYEPQIIPRGDYARVLAEFWADGPNSETPPGHWFSILNYINDHPLFEKKYRGQGPMIDDLEWDVKAYIALGGAMHDAAVTAWGIKGYYDYIRPVSAIRAMADLGQSTSDTLPSYHVGGIPLVPGYIELVKAGDPLAGSNGENLGKIKVYAWRGPDFINNPAVDDAGVDWILAENWWPYQRPSFVTPPFAGYISGHSTFSRAAAELLTQLTGDEYFPGGLGEFQAPQNQFLVFENGPSVNVSLQWAKYRDASDQCSLSRIWGGIHPPADDMPGRAIGAIVGPEALSYAEKLFFKDSDQDGYFSYNDCNDQNASINPGAEEICDGIDNDCNNLIDDGLTLNTYYADEDADGFGDASKILDTCLATPPSGYVTSSNDCNDSDENQNPNIVEICDGIDNDCDAIADNHLPLFTYYADVDGDGFGDANIVLDTCISESPIGYVLNNFDCNDSYAYANPNGIEICDGLDNDCDGLIDDSLSVFTYYADVDGDGFGDVNVSIDTCLTEAPVGYASNSLDCNDNAAAANPDAVEVCDDLDNDCNGLINDGLIYTTYYVDADGDGFGDANAAIDTCLAEAPVGYVLDSLDCNDNAAAANPDGVEVCDDLDNDCNGLINDGLAYTTYYADADGDGFGDANAAIDTCLAEAPVGYVLNALDCNDNAAAANPDGVEVCDDLDNDCNGLINDGLIYTTYYADADGDGFGDANASIDTCLTEAPVGYVLDSLDCNDNAVAANPDGVEVCDDLDNDCNGLINDGLVYTTYYADTDGDGFGDANAAIDTCLAEAPVGYVLDSLDCNDNAAAANPDGVEVCDDLDNDCNGLINDGLVYTTYYADTDGDGFGDANAAIDTCLAEAPVGYVLNSLDCNDNAAAANPDGVEVCDDLDNDCNGLINDGLVYTTYYADADGDGFGDANAAIDTCLTEAPNGYVLNALDCNDNAAAANPDGVEVCDDLDNDCNGLINDGLVYTTYYVDADGDGFGDANAAIDTCLTEAPNGYVLNALDCNDNAAAANPDGVEVCDDLDNDCNGLINDGLVYTTYYVDADGDGFGDANASIDTCLTEAPTGYVLNFSDCNDNNINQNPGLIETCDGVDNDCNGMIDDGLTFTTYFADADGDGFGDINNFVDTCLTVAPTGYVINSSDCNDNDINLNPNVAEICDGVDNDCNGMADDGLTFTTYYADVDGDGFGDTNNFVDTCLTEAPTGYVINSSDCNDSDINIYPTRVEICDGVDNDCNGMIDDGLTFTTYFADTDGDGFGDVNNFVNTCMTEAPTGYVNNSSDCNDIDKDINPNSVEICDGIDNDCNGMIDDGLVFTNYYADADGDGFGDELHFISSCADEIPVGYVLNSLDCDDLIFLINPNAVEILDTLDNDCNGLIDDINAVNEANQNNFKIYPNPFTETVIIEGDYTGKLKVNLYRADGSLIESQVLEFILHKATLHVQQIPEGLYFITMTSSSGKIYFGSRVVKI